MWVEWFGDKTVSLVDEESMKPLQEGLRLRVKKKSKTHKPLQQAIDEACKAHKKMVGNLSL